MSNFISETDFEKINTTLKEKLNSLLEKQTKNNFPEELEKDLNLLCQKIINFQQEENLNSRYLLENDIDDFMDQIYTKYREVLDVSEQEELSNLVCSMRVLACIIAGLYFIKNNELGDNLESVKNLYNGIDLVVSPIENKHDTVPLEIQIQLLELLKKLNLENKNRLSFVEKNKPSEFANYTTIIARTTISGIYSIEENIKKIQEIKQNEKRELALEKLRLRIEEGIKETPETKEFEKNFYEIMDSFRPEGWKLYKKN